MCIQVCVVLDGCCDWVYACTGVCGLMLIGDAVEYAVLWLC